MKKILLIMTTMCVLLLSGCFPTGEKTADKAQYSEIIANAEEINNFSIDNLELPDSYPETLPKIRVTLKEWDVNVSDIVSGGAVIKETKEYPSDRADGGSYIVDMLDNNYFVNNETGRIYYGRFYNNNDYTDEELTAMTQNRICSYIKATYADDLLDVPELDSFGKEEALQRLQTIFAELGITCFGEPLIYTVTAEYANSLDNDRKLSAADEFYRIVYPICFENIPLIYDAQVDIEGTDYPFSVSSRAEAVVSKDGIVVLDMDWICGNEYEKTEDVQISVSPEDALNVIVSAYKDRKLDCETVFNSCKLVYIPIETDGKYSFTYSPAWEFSGYVKHDYGDVVNLDKTAEIVYADTGRRYIGNEV